MNRELLLGYLMGGLDDDEIADVERGLLRDASLREELARLQKELLPLDTVSREEHLPPMGLAERTCARIWAKVDQPAEDFVGRNVSLVRLNRFQMLDEILAGSPNLLEDVAVDNIDSQVSLPPSPQPAPSSPPKRSLPKFSGDSRPGVSESGWRMVDLIASVAVGILIAVIAFPAINYARQQTERMVRQMRMKEFSQAAGFFALTDTKTDDDISSPSGLNLAAAAWREANPDNRQLLHVEGGAPLLAGPPPSLFKQVSARPPQVGERQGQIIFLGQEAGPPPTFGKSYTSLLTDVDRAIPVSNGSLVQPAYGQNVLFQDGRIFFRVLPIFQNTDEF
jgi:hypothetical protein